METRHAGGCQCGAVRYEFTGKPRRLVACHCTDCQTRSGSAFGMSLFLDDEALRITQGELKTYQRTADSGRCVVEAFCPQCGTHIYGKPEWQPDATILRPGTLDDTSWLEPDTHIWTGSKQAWVSIPEGVDVHEASPY